MPAIADVFSYVPRYVPRRSAKAAVSTLFDMEPMIIEDDDDCVELYIQPDTQGEAGDVRDIIIVRKDIRWEIGLSIKHNHFAVKHSRLGKSLDFGDRWFGVPCSQDYWDEIRPIFTIRVGNEDTGTIILGRSFLLA